MKMTALEKIIEWFKENEDVFNDCIEQLDSWNGYLGDDRYYFMEDIDEIYNGSPTDALTRAFYGYDEEDYSTDSTGNTIHAPFCPNRPYFRFNGYGNLVSADSKDYSDHLDSYTIEELEKYRNRIDAIDENDELSELFDELENA